MMVEGTPYLFAGELVLEVPAEVAAGCTRKKVFLTGGAATAPLVSTAVRRQDGRVLVVLPVGLRAELGVALRLEIALGRDTRPSGPPADLLHILAARGLRLDGLPEHELRHLVSMVREARDPEVRGERIAAVIARLEERVA